MSEEVLRFGPCHKRQQLVLDDDTTDILLVGGGAGGGKALRHGEKVLTDKGFVNIEYVKLGDTIVSPDNTLETVVGVHPQGVVDIYKVKFQDGVDVEVCGNHLWEVHYARRGTNKVVKSTLELIEAMEKGQRPIVALTNPVDLPPKGELQLRPYTLGALIGDGCLRMRTPSITCSEPHILNRIMSDGYKLGKNTAPNDFAACHGILDIYDVVEKMGVAGHLSKTKFIPEQYKYASIEDRWALIQGLMDTDGYVSEDGKTYFYTTSEQLSIDVEFVLRSLGFTVTKTVKKGKYKKDGKTFECSDCYCLYIRGVNQKQLFSLPRKADRTRSKSVGNRIVEITKVGQDYATCISITGDRKCFLTTNFVVTHNSFLSLLKCLSYIQDPNAKVVIFRTQLQLLKVSGGLVEESKGIFPYFGGEYKVQDMKWYFPNGASVKFAQLASEKDNTRYLGMQATHILIDEAADDWTQSQILFLRSRMRSAKYKGKLQMILTCNPNRESFLYEWVKPLLDEETGIPRKYTEQVVRYFVNVGGKLHWSDTREELVEQFKYTMEEVMPLSFRFIPIGVKQNPILMKNNPSYYADLLAQSRINQARFLHGSWTARIEGEGFWRSSWVQLIEPSEVPRLTMVARGWDTAGSKPSETNKNPDYTAGVKLGRDAAGTYYILDAVRFQETSGTVIMKIAEVAHSDGDDVTQVIQKDTGAAGLGYFQHMATTLAEMGVAVKPDQVSGHSGKLSKFKPFASLCENGSVKMVRGDWNDDYILELESFTGERSSSSRKDDLVDATSSSFNFLSRHKHLPHFVVPDMSRPSPLRLIN